MFAEFDATPNSISAEDLAGVRTPALVISGVDSHPALRAIATRLARALPNPRWIEFADCGHVTYAEQPERFAAAVAVFAHEIFHTATPNLARAEWGRSECSISTPSSPTASPRAPNSNRNGRSPKP
jgi:hypothetical protein